MEDVDLASKSEVAKPVETGLSFSLDSTEQQLLDEFGVLTTCEYCYAVT